MGKCLVTKLNGSIYNERIPKLGELKIEMNAVSNPSAESSGFIIELSTPEIIRVVGANFTSSKLTDNLGSTLPLGNSNKSNVYVANKDATVFIPNKYNIKSFELSNVNKHAIHSQVCFDIAELAYSKDLTVVNLQNSDAFGDVAAFKGMKKLQYLSLQYNNNISGNLNELSGMSSLKGISFTGDKNVICDMNDVATLTELEFIGLPNNVYNDLSLLPQKINSVYCNGAVSWKGTRDTSSKIITCGNLILGNDVDNFLINQAQCVKSTTGNIGVTGTRTSASDSAVSTLKGYGYIIYVNGVKL